MIDPRIEAELSNGGDCFAHYHSSDRVRTHDDVTRLDQLETSATPTTNPKRESFGIGLYLRGGDFLHPTGDGNWFSEPYFKTAIKFFCPIPVLPFVNWNLFGWKGYLGCKVYGVDSPAYTNWIPASDVYEGSQAIHFSARFSIND